MSEETVAKLQLYKEKTKTDGETLVREVFPTRVFEMEKLLGSNLFKVPSPSIYQKINLPVPSASAISWNGGMDGSGDGLMNTSQPDGEKPLMTTTTKGSRGCPIYHFPGGAVPHNNYIKDMIEAIKPHLTQLMIEAQLVRLWIQFNVPRIEDGNNFGVGIQEEVLSEASGIERDALTFLDQFTRYYASRGKLVGKIAKYPHIDDYRECVRDMDEKQAISLRYVIMEIRNHYAVLHDLIVKNIDRIKVPRSNNTMNMY